METGLHPVSHLEEVVPSDSDDAISLVERGSLNCVEALLPCS